MLILGPDYCFKTDVRLRTYPLIYIWEYISLMHNINRPNEALKAGPASLPNF